MTTAEQHSAYNRSEKGRARYARYRETLKGRANERRQKVRLRVREREALIRTIEKELTNPQVP